MEYLRCLLLSWRCLRPWRGVRRCPTSRIWARSSICRACGTFLESKAHAEASDTDPILFFPRTGIAAGSPVPDEVMRRLVSRMNLRDVCITYGQTETSPASTMSRTSDPLPLRCTTVGQVLPHTHVRIVDPLHEAYPDPDMPSVEVGQAGELWSGGYAVFKGYWGNEEETNKCSFVDREGVKWMRTGDQATMDEEGYVRIVGRIKDLIIRGGENLFPVVIEARTLLLPGIEDCSFVVVAPSCPSLPFADFFRSQDNRRTRRIDGRSRWSLSHSFSFDQRSRRHGCRSSGAYSKPLRTSERPGMGLVVGRRWCSKRVS